MSLALGLIAAALLGDGAGKPAEPAWIGYTIRMTEAPALEWRKACYFQLNPLGRQGACQVWTMPRAAAEAMQGVGGKAPIATARLIALPDSKAVIDSHTDRHFVTDVTRVVSGPLKAVTQVAYQPHAETISVGYTAGVSAHETPAGLAAKVSLESTWVADVREMTTPVQIQPGAQCSCVATVQVPQVVSAEVTGEWTIPEGHVLVISLGTQAVASASLRQTPLVERLAIIDARKVARPVDEVVPVAFHVDALTAPASEPQVVATRAHPMPPRPSRSMLTAIGPDGKVIAPTPVADDAVAPVSFPGSPTPRPSPQMSMAVSASASVAMNPDVPASGFEPTPIGRSQLHQFQVSLPPLPDPAVAPASFTSPASPRPVLRAITSTPALAIDPNVATAKYEPVPVGRSAARLDGAELATGKSQTIRIPFGGKLAIEIKARVVPGDQPE